jgi:hypothetical protein
VHPAYDGVTVLEETDRPNDDPRIRVLVNDHSLKYTQKWTRIVYGMDVTTGIYIVGMSLLSLMKLGRMVTKSEPFDFPKVDSVHGDEKHVLYASKIISFLALVYLPIASAVMIGSRPYLHVRLQLWLVVPIMSMSMAFRSTIKDLGNLFYPYNVFHAVMHLLSLFLLAVAVGQLWHMSQLSHDGNDGLLIPHSETIILYEPTGKSDEITPWSALYVFTFGFLFLLELAVFVLYVAWLSLWAMNKKKEKAVKAADADADTADALAVTARFQFTSLHHRL